MSKYLFPSRLDFIATPFSFMAHLITRTVNISLANMS